MPKVFRKNNFIEHSLKGILVFFRDSVLSEEQAAYPGLLQSIDPRVKVVTFLLLCVAALVTKNIYSLVFLYSFSILLALFSKLNLGFFLKRTWVFIPLFSLLIAIPAAFSFVTPGETLFTFKLIGLSLTVTRQGLAGAVLFVSRVAVSVSFMILLNLTTRSSSLFRVLRFLKVPQVFVMVLGMSYRYIYLFMEIVENTYLGIKSRTGALIHYKKGQSIVAWNIATLWQRSYKLNEDVYQAMLSRGYQGEPVLAEGFKSNFKDWVWVFLVAVIFAGVVIFRNG